jgi:1-phosphofructokinase family hexose kinase
VIITVTLNAAIDKTLEVPNFQLGRRHRSVEQRSLAGGKGVNVARAIKRLGQPVVATGFAGGPTGSRIVEQLTEESVLNDFVHIHQESRMNTAVLDPTIRVDGSDSPGEVTEINEPGPEVSAQEVELFCDKLLYLAKGAQICVFAGSLPRGPESDLYARMVRDVARVGVTTVLDTDGEPLRHGVRAEPAVISPNVLEAEALVGHEFNDDDDRAEAVLEMTRLGAHEALMTVGDGCFARVHDNGSASVVRVRVAEQDARSPIGSGDAFLAGFLASTYSGRDPIYALRYAVACGAESTQHFGAGVVEPGRVERLLPEVEVERLAASAKVG